MADDQESWPDRPSTVGEGSGIGGDTGVDINWDWDRDLGLFDPYQEEIDENQVQPPAQQSAHAPNHSMQPDVVPAHPSSHIQPHASGNSSELSDIEQQQTMDENRGSASDLNSSSYNDHNALFNSVNDSQTIQYTGEMPSASGQQSYTYQQKQPSIAQPTHTYQQPFLGRQPAHTYQQPLLGRQPAHTYQQPLLPGQPAQAYQRPLLAAQPAQTYQQALPITEQHIQPDALFSPEPVGLFPSHDMPNFAGQVTQSDSPVQPTQDLSQRHYLHQQGSRDLFPKPGQPTQGLGQPDKPGAGSLRTPLSNQREGHGHVVTPIRPFRAPHQIQSGPISAQVTDRRSKSLGMKIAVIKQLEEMRRNGRGGENHKQKIATELGLSGNTIQRWWQQRDSILLEEQRLNVIKYVREKWTDHRDKQGSIAAAAHHFGFSTDTVVKWWDERDDPETKDEVIRFIQENPRQGRLREAALHFDILYSKVRTWWAAARRSALRETNNPEEEYDTEDLEGEEDMEGIENLEDREGQLQRQLGTSDGDKPSRKPGEPSAS